MTSQEIQKRIEKLEETSDLSRIEFKFQKQAALAMMEVALQLAIQNEHTKERNRCNKCGRLVEDCCCY